MFGKLEKLKTSSKESLSCRDRNLHIKHSTTYYIKHSQCLAHFQIDFVQTTEIKIANIQTFNQTTAALNEN